MNLREAFNICSSLPLFGYVITTLIHLLPCLGEDEAETSSNANVAAQKQFKQLQHIRAS